MVALNVAILLIVVFGVIYTRTPRLISIIAVGLVLFFLTYLTSLNFVMLICWAFYFTAVLFLLVKPLRVRFFTRPLVQFLEKRMPPISDTERDAIEAGDIWWEKDLFCGRPNWHNLLKIPTPRLTDEEQSFLDNEVETLCSLINDWQVLTVDHNLSKEVWDYIKKERFFGLVIPKEYGGRGFSALAHSSVVVKIGTRSVSAAVNTMVPNSLGPAELIEHYGTTEQKNYYLPRLARGEEIPCFALTGPEAGSDAGSITDTGIICYGDYEGQNILGIKLTWDKRYITLAPLSTVLGIAFRLYDPDHLLGKSEDVGITLALIPTSHPGVEIGNRHIPLNLAFMNGPTRGTDVFIPMDWIIGGVARAGQGWRMLMESLSIGRSISLPALSTACGNLTYRTTGAYARLRRQFNVPISQFEGIEEALGCIAGYAYMLEATRVMTAGAVDLKLRPAIASAISKYHMTEMARKVISNAMDVHAGHGIQMGPRNYLAACYLAMPVSITVEGANILTRNLIIFGQGAIRCHPYILEEVNLFAAKDDQQKINKLDRLLLSHIGYALSNFVRTFWIGLTGGIFLRAPVNDDTSYYFKQLTRLSSALALLADMSMLILGGSLKRRERVSARLGDVLSQLYMSSAVLKYFHDQKKPASDLNNVKWCLQHALYEIQMALDDLCHNFPFSWVGKLLHFIVFPWGRAYKKPSDTLTHEIVSAMLEPGEMRNRLTKNCFVGKDKEEPIRRLDEALSKVKEIEPIWRKLQNAIRSGAVSRKGNLKIRTQSAVDAKFLSMDEMNALLEFDSLYQEVIKVNEFTFDLRSVIN